MLKLNEKSAKSTYIILALSIIMLVIVGIRLYSDTYAAFMQKDIASQIIRSVSYTHLTLPTTPYV